MAPLSREGVSPDGRGDGGEGPLIYNPVPMDAFSSTTVLLVRRHGKVCMASDGQVTMNQSTIVKSGAKKVRRIGKGKVLVGFAGGGADGLALLTRLEAKLEEFNNNLERSVVELAKEWRLDRALRQLQAVIVVTDIEKSFFVSGAGELLQPDDEDGVLAIGSGFELRSGRRPRVAAQYRHVRRRDRAGVDEDRLRDLHLHQRPLDP